MWIGFVVAGACGSDASNPTSADGSTGAEPTTGGPGTSSSGGAGETTPTGGATGITTTAADTGPATSTDTTDTTDTTVTTGSDAVCGNGLAERFEDCDGTDLLGEDCLSQGFDGGTLACARDCLSLDASGCHVCGDDLGQGPEVCDGLDLMGEDCATQGFPAGALVCEAGCASFDASGCFGCGCAYDWDDGLLSSWTILSTCPFAATGWTVHDGQSLSPPYALYYGDPLLNNFDCLGMTNSGTATSPAITLPTAPFVSFEVFIDTEGGTQLDLLDLLVVPTVGAAVVVWQRSDFPEGFNGNTMGMFFTQVVDLSAWSGQEIQLRWSFDTVDGIGNMGLGVYIDDILVNCACP